MAKTTRMWLLVGVLIIATFLRFYQLTTTPPGLYPDEAMNGNNAAEVAATGQFKVFYPEDNGREGLYVNLLALEFMVFHAPHEPWAVRLPAAVAGVLTVLGVYLLVAELFGDGAGLLAAFLLATSFWHINFSRIAFRAILSPLFLTWSLLLLIKAFRAARDKTAAWWYAIAAGVVYALGFYTYIAYRITPLLLLLFIPFFKKNPDFWKRVGVFLVAAFIVAAPIGLYFATHPADFFGRTGEISVTSTGNPIETFAVNAAKTALELNVQGDFNWRQNVSGATELWWPVGLLFLLGLVLAIWWVWNYWRDRGRSHEKQIGASGGQRALGFAGNLQHLNAPFGLWIAIIWLGLGALPAALSNEGIPHALRSILMVVPAMILAAVGGVWLYRLIKKHWGVRLAQLLAFLFLVAVASFGYVDYFVIWAQNPNVPGSFNADYVAIGNDMNALPSSTPKYVVVNAGGVIARGLPVPAETVIFMTNSFTTSTQEAQNIHYLLPDQSSTIPAGTPSSSIFFID